MDNTPNQLPVLKEAGVIDAGGQGLCYIIEGMIRYDGTPHEIFRHHKELEQIGLMAPEVTYLFHDLRERGIPVSRKVTTVKEAKEEILRVLGRSMI